MPTGKSSTQTLTLGVVQPTLLPSRARYDVVIRVSSVCECTCASVVIPSVHLSVCVGASAGVGPHTAGCRQERFLTRFYSCAFVAPAFIFSFRTGLCRPALGVQDHRSRRESTRCQKEMRRPTGRKMASPTCGKLAGAMKLSCARAELLSVVVRCRAVVLRVLRWGLHAPPCIA